MKVTDLLAFQVIRRDGHRVDFDPSKIRNAIANAFLKDARGQPRRADLTLSTAERGKIDSFTEQVVNALTRRKPAGGAIGIEEIQDQVELALMRAGEHEIARDYVLFRASRAEHRNAEKFTEQSELTVVMIDGDERRPIGSDFIAGLVEEACEGIQDADPVPIVEQAMRDIYDEMPREKVEEAVLLAARSMIEKDPAYGRVTARVFLRSIRREVIGEDLTEAEMATRYASHLAEMVECGIAAKRLDPRLAEFDLARLGAALKPERDRQFRYIGLQTLYDRYFIHVEERRIELPQSFFMRIAMGLALNEADRNGKAIEFYEVLSSFRFMSSTPTLFNSGTVVPQLSSCYLTTVSDDLDGIFEAIKENAMLQKYAGGLGNDWTCVRALGSWIRGTNGRSQGLIPFLKVVNDTAVAVNQGGKRKGAVCAYLETWHLDIEEFLELRKNTGDDRRRTHDMNTANWIPDLFMKRVMEDGEWTLFTPVDVPDLHEKYGKAFEEAYVAHEARAARGEIKLFKKASAVQLWRKMLTMLFETGHPWITFKDACNVRSPQQHAGVVHSSNLCVAPETLVLTDKGHMPIRELVGKRTSVWNGLVFSEVEIVKTGENQKLITVMLDNGSSLDCTPYHKFYIQDTYERCSIREVRAAELKPGDGLIKFSLPIINDRDWPNFPYAYTHGFFCGDGTYSRGRPCLCLYGDKKPLAPFIEISNGSGSTKGDASGRLNYTLPHDLPEKFDVPGQHSLESRVHWLEGFADADGTITNNRGCESLQINSIHFKFLVGVKSMLQTLGVESRVSLAVDAAKRLLPDGAGGVAEFSCQALYRLLISHGGLQQLAKLGFRPKRLKFECIPTQREARHFVRVVAVEDRGRVDDTYCFAEPRRRMGVFNGVLTGQCTEITLNTSDEEIAVCNLGSVNLAAHLEEGKLDLARLQRTVNTAMRMLDNVIDLNFYSVDKAKVSNLRHRPVGLGIMGFQDCLHELRIPYASSEALEFADRSTEAVCFFAYLASAELAEERGTYPSYLGSLWSNGILPHETLDMLAGSRGGYTEVDRSVTLDWEQLRERIRTSGMRNSNCVAIAPTATIANIVGVSASIEPSYQNLFVKSNLSGEFTVVNEYLVEDLKRLGIWDAVMVSDLKHFDGSVQAIDRVPDDLQRLYATAFEINPKWLIEAAARRQKWIDQAQSLNLYFKGASGKALDEAYKLAWLRGLKTTYYLRSLGATAAEKSTSKSGALNAVSSEMVSAKACAVDNPDCEACE